MSASRASNGTDANLAVVAGLEPAPVWRQFAAIAAVPRCSEHEEKIRQLIIDFAKERNLEWVADSAGNLVVRKPAAEGFTSRPKVVIQGHLDMVCEKNEGTPHEFGTDPIKMALDGDWLCASGTTLGADNGIAVAMALAILGDRTIQHGPLEALFTVNEEGGLVGATKLDGSIVTGRIILNLDSEDEGTFYVGCAGGCNTEGWLPMQAEPASSGIASGVSLSVAVKGLRGGHSGAEIHEGRGNAIHLGARFLWNASQRFALRIYRADGGGLHNAIPREFFAGVIVGEENLAEIERLAAEHLEIYRSELGDIEPSLTLEVRRTEEAPVRHLNEDSTDRLLTTLYTLPHGVRAMSRRVPGLVDGSTNLAAVHLSEHEAHILTSQRGTLDSMTLDLSDRIRAIIEHAGGRIKTFGSYPGWQPDPDSQLAKTCAKLYEELSGRSPKVTAIHAGLECGVLSRKLPGSQLISFGPNIQGAHTPGERVDVQSTGRVWRFLVELLKRIG